MSEYDRMNEPIIERQFIFKVVQAKDVPEIEVLQLLHQVMQSYRYPDVDWPSIAKWLYAYTGCDK